MKSDLSEALKKAGLTNEHSLMVAENKLIATIAVAEISRICTAVQTAATRLATDDRKIHTGPVNVHSIKAGIGRLADRRQKLTITALAEELGVTRQNLNRSIRKDRELLTAYTASVEKAQQETGVARRTQKK